MNFFNRKNQKRIASVICILVIIAMVLPMVLEYLVK
ncbi:unknown [Clostridium sp. CAG:75]|jgi:Ca2+/H+ antiporter|nr:unknown [Clostridium sp. CAG:75]